MCGKELPLSCTQILALVTAGPRSGGVHTSRAMLRSHSTVVRPPIGGRAHRRGGPRWHHCLPHFTPMAALIGLVRRKEEESEGESVVGTRILMKEPA
jgi:hypothetical protein